MSTTELRSTCRMLPATVQLSSRRCQVSGHLQHSSGRTKLNVSQAENTVIAGSQYDSDMLVVQWTI